MLLKKGESLNFRYSAFFQSVDIKLFCEDSGDGPEITCQADVKIPVLKKNYLTSTVYDEGSCQWREHSPVREESAAKQRVVNSPEFREAMDPITFFLTLHSKGWTLNFVKLLIGSKIVVLDVTDLGDGYEVRRQDKDQRLIVRRDAEGIRAIEIPIPVLGSITIKRV